MKKVFMNGLDFYQNPKIMILNHFRDFWDPPDPSLAFLTLRLSDFMQKKNRRS